MAKQLHKLLQLPPGERRLLFVAAALFPLIAALLHIAGYKHTIAFCRRFTRRPPAMEKGVKKVGITPDRVAVLVGIAAGNNPVKSTCLRKSILTHWLLVKRGVPADLRIGVSKKGGGLIAHAWVEHDGVALNENPAFLDSLSPFDGDVATR